MDLAAADRATRRGRTARQDPATRRGPATRQDPATASAAWRDPATWRGRARTAEAAVLLIGATAARRLLPARRLTLLLGRPGPVAAGVEPPLAVTGREREVGAAVMRASRRLPVPTSCLDRAITARALLRAAGRRPAVVIGLAPGEAPAAGSSGWGAHAWLVGDTGVVVGGAEAAAFTPVTVFR